MFRVMFLTILVFLNACGGGGDSSSEENRNDVSDTAFSSIDLSQSELIEGDLRGEISQLKTVINDSGELAVVWRQGSNDIWLRRYSIDSGWQSSERLDVLDTVAIRPRVSLDNKGNILVVWQQDDEFFDMNVWYRYFDVNTGWSDAQIFIDTEFSILDQDLKMASNSNGQTIIVWREGHTNSILSNRFSTETGNWGGNEMIFSDVNEVIGLPEIAMNHNGNAVAVWDSWTGTNSRIWAVRYINGFGFESAELIATGGLFSSTKVDLNNAGDIHVLWNDSENVGNGRLQILIRTARYEPGNGWQQMQTIDSQDDGIPNAFAPSIVVNDQGGAVAVWNQDYGLIENSWASVYESGTGWTSGSSIDTNNEGQSSPPKIAKNSEGILFALWSRLQIVGDDDDLNENDIRDSLWVNRYSPDGGWIDSLSIVSNDSANLTGALAVNNDIAKIVWLREGNISTDMYIVISE